MHNSYLLNQIEQFKLDSTEASLTFAKRVARENDWSDEYTQRVIREYKRFIYMAAVSDDDITPSDQVDQVWHLHLTYTHSYWKDMCEGILGFELHHKPTEGGEQEQHRYNDQYMKTLILYNTLFGHEPPSDIWPNVEKRFEAVESFVRANKRYSWILPKPKYGLGSLFVFLLTTFMLTSCVNDEKDIPVWGWVLIVTGIYLIYKILVMAIKLSKHKDSGSGCGSGGCGGCGGCGGG